MKLSEVPLGVSVRLVAIHATAFALKQRLLDMGVARGAVIQVIRAAPLGDPIEIQIKSSRLALRRAECSCIEVELIEADK